MPLSLPKLRSAGTTLPLQLYQCEKGSIAASTKVAIVTRDPPQLQEAFFLAA